MRPAHALIDLAALRHNYAFARQLHGGRGLAVLKANAYGHGAVRCGLALADQADGFAVAFCAEALPLRAAGLEHPILLLEGAFDGNELLQAVEHNLWLVVHHEEQLRMIERTALQGPLHIWLKVNTGMNRAGFGHAALLDAWQRLQACGKVAEIVLMSHFARADEDDPHSTLAQIERFDHFCSGLDAAHSLANSAAILAWPQARRQWSRPGILLYGADPLLQGQSALQPVMTLHSEVMAVREVSAGEAIGYGARFVAPRDLRVGLVAIGYADGYPRTVPDGTPIQVDGQRSRIIGRVSMDMLSVDLSALPQAGVGSRVELWGREVPINEVAAAAGTISYELLCNVKRVPLCYQD